MDDIVVVSMSAQDTCCECEVCSPLVGWTAASTSCMSFFKTSCAANEVSAGRAEQIF